MSAAAKTVHIHSTERPDIAWIRKYVPVLEVGRELGLSIRRGRTQCWRMEKHAHGDADPSLQFYVRGNRVRCFVCDMRGGMSNIDLVMGVLRVGCARAALWIAERFPVPETKPGRPRGTRSNMSTPYRVGVNGSEFEVLIRSGVWGQLTPAERTILKVLHTFRDLETMLTRMSYCAIMRYGGVGSRSNVSRALRHLERIGAIETYRATRVGIIRDVNLYRVTLESEKLLQLCAETYRKARPEVDRERAMHRELRISREIRASGRANAKPSQPTVVVNGKGGLCPPAPPAPLFPFERVSKNQHHTPFTCEGLNLSSPGEPKPSLSVPIGNREISEAEWQRRKQEQKAKLDDWLRQHPANEIANIAGASSQLISPHSREVGK